MNDIDEKTVREARTRARRLAKTTDLTYQQALDRVAAEYGHADWNSLRGVVSDAVRAKDRRPDGTDATNLAREKFLDQLFPGAKWARKEAVAIPRAVALHRRIAVKLGIDPAVSSVAGIMLAPMPTIAAICLQAKGIHEIALVWGLMLGFICSAWTIAVGDDSRGASMRHMSTLAIEVFCTLVVFVQCRFAVLWLRDQPLPKGIDGWTIATGLIIVLTALVSARIALTGSRAASVTFPLYAKAAADRAATVKAGKTG